MMEISSPSPDEAMQILDVGDSRSLKCRLGEHASVMRVGMAGVNPKTAIVRSVVQPWDPS